MGERLYTIGQVARLSGVPVKTIRFYSDAGVLPPSHVTDAGYRLYSDADRLRLELIRSLRGLGFSLPTIARLLHAELEPADAVRLQLRAVEVQIKALQRQRAVLRAALARGERGTLAYLAQAQALAKLSALERETFLAEHLDRGLDGLPVDPAWKADFWRRLAVDLPEDLTEAQLEAWLELAAIVADEDFWRRQRDQVQPFWEAARDGFDAGEWREVTGRIFEEAAAAVRAGRSPRDADAQRLADDWVAINARALGRAPDAVFARELLASVERGVDPRAERLWELVGMLRGCDDAGLRTRAFHWLLDGLRWRVARSEGTVAVEPAPPDRG